MNWKIAIPIAVVLFLVVGFVGMKDKDENAPMVLEKSGEPSTLAQTTPVAPSIPVVAPTDNVDDLVGSLFSEADSDLTLLSDSDQDISLVSSDSAEITNLTTAYDENTL